MNSHIIVEKTPELRNILLVEDNPGDVRLLLELLRESGNKNHSLVHVDRITLALETLQKTNFDILLLDLSLPDSTGLASVRQICGAVPHLPIIVLTGLDDNQLAIEAVQTGAQDYLVKGQINGPLLIRAMSHAIQRKKMEEHLLFLATHDSLTNLPNRALFEDRLNHAADQARRNRRGTSPKVNIAVMLLDLDHFKVINDTMGHPKGDRLLQAVAVRLQSTIRQSDTVARMGGDEFMLIFENVTGFEDAKILVTKIQDVFSQPFEVEGTLIHTTASIGVSLYPDDGGDFKSLLQTADIAMYHAKKTRNHYSFYHLLRDCL